MYRTAFALILVALFAAEAPTQQVITVDNKPNSPGQFKDLQVAIDSASNGDIIYVSGSSYSGGSPTSYGNITIKKRLTLYGTGYRPNKELPLRSIVGFISLDEDLPAGTKSTGTRIIGFEIVQLESVNDIDSIEVRRNMFSVGVFIGGPDCSAWIIENNIMTYPYSPSIDLNRASNIIINNNITQTGIIDSDQPSVVIGNNLFLGEGSQSAFEGVYNAIISNNIFYGNSPRGCSFSSFNYNITYRTPNDTIPYSDNTGSSNLVAVDPQFVNFPDAGGGFSFDYDFFLKPGSPAIGTGTDGTDIGIYGGASPIQIGGEPRLPQIKSMIIDNVLPVDGTMHIVVKAKKQN